jgi:hypothetical protein
MLIEPMTPRLRAIFLVYSSMALRWGGWRVTGGRTPALSPEWTPASSMCSMIPAMKTSTPSAMASTSNSWALSR